MNETRQPLKEIPTHLEFAETEVVQKKAFFPRGGGEIESVEQLRQITDDDIQNVWYVKAIKGSRREGYRRQPMNMSTVVMMIREPRKYRSYPIELTVYLTVYVVSERGKI